MKKPLILVTNDDGITAPGINFLTSIVAELGNVIVVAPDSPQSGMGHAITVDNTLSITKISNENDTITKYTTSGTPADCVKIAKNEIIKDKIDLCVSGINHGGNASINVLYSGTMSAAIEAGIEGIPAIGFSLADFSWKANFEPTRNYIKKIIEAVLQNGLPKDIVLNVNFPKLNTDEIKGIKICRQAKAKYVEKFDKRQSPFGKEYYWLAGEFECHDKAEDTDIWALENGYISIVPIQFDMTAHQAIQQLNLWNL
jgi:5'-nucleotidase